MRKRNRVILASVAAGAAAIAGTLYIVFFTGERTSPSQKPLPSVEALASLPYLTWVSAEESMAKSGVTLHDRRRSFSGINLYNSRNLSRAHLMDMEGNVLHTWSMPQADISEERSKENSWHHIEACPNGDLLAIVKDKILIRMGWDSRIKWIKRMRFHHDIALAENNDIFALVREDEFVYFYGIPIPFINDYLVILSPGGMVKEKLSLFDALGEEIPPERLVKIIRWVREPDNWRKIEAHARKHKSSLPVQDPFDILHTNTVEILERNAPGLCQKGDLLVCILKLNLIGILSMESRRIVWKWGEKELSGPHHPTHLNNGNILIFDNGVSRKYSRIVELDPIQRTIVWEYTSGPAGNFFSEWRGASQRLPNGNTLVTESDRGRVFEITRSGEIVWEFYNPVIKKEEKQRAAIYRMMRLYDVENYPFLKRIRSAGRN